MAYLDASSTWTQRPPRSKGDTRLFPHTGSDLSSQREKARELNEMHRKVSEVDQAPAASEARDTSDEKLEILKSLKDDGLLPDTPVYMANHINAFLFLAFFPLGLALYCYGRVFGTSLRVALTVFAMWMLNTSIIVFVL